MMVAPKRRMDSKLQIASIFSGCGGFDFGFQQEGFKSIAAFDNDEDAAETFRHNVDASMEVRDLLDRKSVV